MVLILDGKTHADRMLAEVRAGGGRPRRPGPAPALPGGGAGGRGPGQPGLRERQDQGLRPDRDPLPGAPDPRRHRPGGPGGPDRRAQPGPGGGRHPGAAAPARPAWTPSGPRAASIRAKDVDGLHPVNQGLLLGGQRGLRPCTPSACISMLKAYGIALKGSRAVVLGRSEIVGKPIGLMLLEEHATVTIAHSRTVDLPGPLPGGGPAGGGGGPARPGGGLLDQARRRGGGRGHQPGRGPGTGRADLPGRPGASWRPCAPRAACCAATCVSARPPRSPAPSPRSRAGWARSPSPASWPTPCRPARPGAGGADQETYELRAPRARSCPSPGPWSGRRRSRRSSIPSSPAGSPPGPRRPGSRRPCAAYNGVPALPRHEQRHHRPGDHHAGAWA